MTSALIERRYRWPIRFFHSLYAVGKPIRIRIIPQLGIAATKAGFHCRLLIADCRLKKWCGNFLPCQSARRGGINRPVKDRLSIPRFVTPVPSRLAGEESNSEITSLKTRCQSRRRVVRPYIFINLSPFAPQMGQASGALPISIFPQTGHKKKSTSVRSFPC